MIVNSSFKPAWWLLNSHAQTLYPTLARRIRSPIDKTERFELPDGDFVDLAWAVNGVKPDAPLVVLLHGLGGNANSKYAAGLLQVINQCGWRGAMLHFRGASHEPNRLPRAYHSGETGDLDYLLRVLAAREPHTKKAVVGVSMGGNVLLKWLGEQGPQSLIQAAVAVSVPFELNVVADRINLGFSRIYQASLLASLRRVFHRKLEKYPEDFSVSPEKLNSIRCFWTFDEQVTAPLYGFPHVHAYYREASSRQYLVTIATPTLIMHAMDDPFMTPDVIPKAEELSKDILLEVSKRGGHVGFISGSVPGRPTYWLDHRIPLFLRDFF
jgi:predicted alpha/beta-fold hydrolase